jgi:FlaG/FlaF family flagellin (archaellin)
MRVGRPKVRTSRRAVSPILAEIILIFVVLITSAILGGFIFGTVSTFAQPAEVWAHASSCSASAGTETCQLTLINTGVHSTSTVTCMLSLNGAKLQGNVSNGGVIPASGSLNNVGCSVQGATAPSGAQIGGTVMLANGGSVFFTVVSS